MVLNNREKRITDLVLSTGNVSQNTTLAGTSQWSDLSGSDPLGDMKTARITIFDSTGYRPNRIAMGYKVLESLKIHPDIKEIIKYTERAIVTPALLAAVFEVDEVLVGSILRRTSKQGQTDVLTDVWGKDVLVFYAESSPSRQRATFRDQLREEELRVFRYREDKRDVDVIRVMEKQDEKLIASSLGYLIKAAVA